MHDEHLRDVELPVRRFELPKLLATELLPAVCSLPSASWLLAKSKLLPDLRRRRRKFAALLRPMRADRRFHESAALRGSKLRRQLPLIFPWTNWMPDQVVKTWSGELHAVVLIGVAVISTRSIW
jgi:hypothetical protein